MPLSALLLLSSPGLAATPAFLDEGLVLVSPETGAFSAGVGAPTVEYDVATGSYVMYFEAALPTVPAECDTSFAIGRATSSDGVDWVVDPDPIIAPDVGTAGSPFHCVASQPAVVYDGTTWHLFFSTASEPTTDGGANTPTGIAYATSTNGVDFTVQHAPLVAYEGVSMGLASAAIVDGQLTLLYVSYPDIEMASLPLDGSTVWDFEPAPVLDHDDVGLWALEWVLGPSLFCEDDQPDPYALVFGGDDHDGVRSLGFATSADARAWTLDAEDPLSLGDLDYGALKHWDVLEAGTGYRMWYSRTDDATGLKAIGYAATDTTPGPPGPRMCPHPLPPDTTTDSGTTDSGATDDSGVSADTAGLGGDKDGCGCAASTRTPAGLGLLLAFAGLRRRRR